MQFTDKTVIRDAAQLAKTGLVTALASLMLAACASSLKTSSTQRLSTLGESCARTMDCAPPLRCLDQRCESSTQKKTETLEQVLEEVIEHVADRQLFANAIAQMLAPGGTVVITTINRTLAALVLAKFMLEYVVRMVPAGTHDPSKFLRPGEMRAEFAAAGIVLDDMTGFAPRPARRIGANGFMRVSSLAINYAASGTHG